VVDTVPAARLEIVGENRTRRPRLDLEALRRSRRHADHIQLRSYVDDETLAGLYTRASVLVFLSEYEGFGFTPLEALAAGVAPVLLDTPIARETCGLAARYVPPDAGNATIAAAIVDVLTDATVRRQILEDGEQVLGRYDWDLTAADTIRVIEEAALGR
jgi:glycosyltransferase involved in cell wall biosynthesis